MAPTVSTAWDTRAKPLADLHIGPLHIGFPIVQAALSGYSDWPMRILARRMGASYALCEVMLDQFLLTLKDRARNRHFLFRSDEDTPVGGQLMGAEPNQFAAGAKKLVEAGFDAIDVNFGCPVKKVLGRCRGGFHLGQPQIALEILARTRDTVPPQIPVTVKMRRGIDDTPQSRDHFYRILDGAFALGIAAVTVHGRTVQQRYLGPSRWSFLAEVKRHVGDRVILGSGDLFTAKDCLEMLRQTGVNGVTVARGAIGNPWIFAQARALVAGHPLPAPPTLLEQRAVLQEHASLARELYGERAMTLLKKFAVKYAASHPEYETVRTAFTHVRSGLDWEDVLARHYATDRPGCYPNPEIHKAQGSCACPQ